MPAVLKWGQHQQLSPVKTKETVCLRKNAKNGAAAHTIGTLTSHQPAGNTFIASERTAQRVSEAFNQSEQRLDDRVLLRRFLQDADEAAFEEIVKRYQKLVMSICGRILGSGQDAEDAFQATFICLARRPRSIRHSKALSSWLYTVAYRTSWRLVRRRKKTVMENLEKEPMSEPADPLEEISDAQDCVIVDEELNQLPVKFKDVLVMTYFADQSSQQIADTLNVSKGTVDGRIRDARNMLRVKLARRGVTIGAIALAASACGEATAAVSPTVLNSTLLLGSQTLANHTLSTPDLSHINHLIRPETTMLSTKMIAATMLGIAAVGAIGFNGIVSAQQEVFGSTPTGSLNATIDAGGSGTAESDTPSAVVVNTGEAALVKPSNAETVNDGDPFAAGNDAETAGEYLPDPFGAPGEHNESSAGSQAQQTYSQIPSDASAIEQRIYAALDQQTPPLKYPAEAELKEILGTTMNWINQKSQPDQKISLVVDHKALEDAGLNSLEEIFVKDIELSGIKLQTALKLILDQTELDYLIRDDVLFLTTKSEATDNADYYTTRVYPVKKLLDAQTNSDSGMMGGYGGGGLEMGMGMGMGMGEDDPLTSLPRTRNKKSSRKGGLQSLPPQLGGSGMGGGLGGGVLAPREPLIELVCDMTSPPCLWIDRDGNGGAISLAGNSLVVRQSRRGHEEIVKLLNLLANAEN